MISRSFHHRCDHDRKHPRFSWCAAARRLLGHNLQGPREIELHFIALGFWHKRLLDDVWYRLADSGDNTGPFALLNVNLDGKALGPIPQTQRT